MIYQYHAPINHYFQCADGGIITYRPIPAAEHPLPVDQLYQRGGDDQRYDHVQNNTAGYLIPKASSFIPPTTPTGRNRSFVAGGEHCRESNATGLYQGIEKIQFISAPYDSLLGQTFQPITNNYTMVFISGSKAQLQTFQRVVTTPDIVFSARDYADPFPGQPEIGVS